MYSATAVEVHIPPSHDLGAVAETQHIEHRGAIRPLLQFAGRVVGRVPAELSEVIHDLLGKEWVTVISYFTGNLIHRGPVRGGGLQLECCYVLFLGLG